MADIASNSPAVSTELDELPPGSADSVEATHHDANGSTAVTALHDTTTVIVAVPGKHGTHIPLTYNVSSSANGEEFMAGLRRLLQTAAPASLGAKCCNWIVKLLSQESIEMGTVSGLVAPVLVEEGRVFPVSIQFSQRDRSAVLTAGYRWPACLRDSPCFVERLGVQGDNTTEGCVLVLGREANLAVITAIVIVYMAASISFYLIMGVAGHRWDIAASCGAALLMILNAGLALGLWLLKNNR